MDDKAKITVIYQPPPDNMNQYGVGMLILYLIGIACLCLVFFIR